MSHQIVLRARNSKVNAPLYESGEAKNGLSGYVESKEEEFQSEQEVKDPVEFCVRLDIQGMLK
jgi:hypothetical protein